jgi:type I restriction enzyme, S subunit
MREYLPKDWTTKKTSEFCLRVADGTHDTPKPVEEGRPLITSKNLKGGRVDYDDAYMISESDYQQINKRSKVDRWDVLFSMIGTVGEIALIRDEPDFAIKNIGLFKNKTKEDGTWLYYYLTSSMGQAALDTFLSGTSQQFVALGDLRKVPVIVPPDKSKKKVAAILSAYDELIQNNQRRTALLEKLAEEIYREWFIRLRFPGHEKVKRQKRLPDGWQIVELKAVADEAGRSTKPGEHLADRFYLPLDLLNSKQMLPSGHLSHTEAQSSLVTFEKGDFLFGAMRPYQHKVAIAPFAGITRTTCFVIRPKLPASWSWLFLTLFQESSIDFATNICNGSDRPYVVWNKAMERMKLLRPPDSLLARFEEIARSILDSIVNTYFIQLKLVATRDLLLPRLISGKLSVENLEIQFPPGMEEEINVEPTAGAHG